MKFFQMFMQVTAVALFVGNALSVSQEPYEAVIIVPVADLVNEPFFYTTSNVTQAYEDMPVSWGPMQSDKSVCLRSHQALFNEVVCVTETYDKEVCIEIRNAFSQSSRTLEQGNIYWTLKKNICPIKTLPAAVRHYIPQPLNYHDKDLYQANVHIFTLTWPCHDAVTKKRFSAGTRFVYAGATNHAYITHVYDSSIHGLRRILIPKRYALLGTPVAIESRITTFVNLLRDWARATGFIPMVWGGISFTKLATMEGFALQRTTGNDGQRRGYWALHEGAEKPYAGFDASGLVLRAAQICGIPYFFKNTTAAILNLRPIGPLESLQEGDLIGFQGGLVVVSNLAENKLISSFGYQFGFGKVAERSLGDMFEGINTYNDLLEAYKGRKPLKIKNGEGAVVATLRVYTVLKLRSLWE